MATNLTGPIYSTRQGSDVVVHTYPVAYSTTGISSGILLDVIKASSSTPVQVEVSCQVVAAFNAESTNVLTVGTTTAATQWLASGDIDETTTGYYPASNAVGKFRLVADTNMYVKYTQTGTAASAGSAVVMVRMMQENTKAIV